MQDGQIGNGNKVIELVIGRLDKLDKTVEDGFREIREDRGRVGKAVAALDVRLALAEREVDNRPCDEHSMVIKQTGDRVQALADQVNGKLAWRPMLVAVTVGVVAFILSKWGGGLLL